MPRTLVIRERAEADIDEETRYYMVNDGPETAVRFLDDMTQAFDRLFRFPKLGDVWPTPDRELRGLRHLPLPRFPYWLFYLHSDEAIEVIRVLHHRRDVAPLLEDW